MDIDTSASPDLLTVKKKAMQREIRIRLWDKVNQKMYTPDYPFIGCGSGAMDIAVMLDGSVIFPSIWNQPPLEEAPSPKNMIKMLDIGIADVSNTEVFTDDLLEKDGLIYEIEFVKGCYEVFTKDIKGREMYRYKIDSAFASEQFKIAGNKHQNPELIK